jgi:hypothetical protein
MASVKRREMSKNPFMRMIREITGLRSALLMLKFEVPDPYPFDRGS